MASTAPAPSIALVALLTLAACRPVDATRGQIHAPGVGAVSSSGGAANSSDLNAGARARPTGGPRVLGGALRDAVMMFKEAHRLGGPASELWNVSRALERLDQPEEAANQIVEYLGEQGLAAEDRGEAQREPRPVETALVSTDGRLGAERRAPHGRRAGDGRGDAGDDRD